jgi:hypothetical protein
MMMKTMKVLMNINVEQFTCSISKLCVAIVIDMGDECDNDKCNDSEDDDKDMNEE